MSVRTNFVLFPLDSEDLLNALSRSGYVIIQRNIPQAPLGVKVDISGSLARKGQAVVSIDSASQVVSAQGPNPWEVSTIFEELDRIINKDLSINIRQNTMYFECASAYHIVATTNPLKTMSKIKQPDLYPKLAKILQQDVVNYSLHICSPSGTVNQPDWFDMTIRPVGSKSDTTYEVITVFRKREKAAIAQFLTNIEERINAIISMLEAYNR